MLYTVTLVYDSAVFAHPALANDVVQRLVERPHVYLLAMAADTVADKLMYIPDRYASFFRCKLCSTCHQK